MQIANICKSTFLFFLALVIIQKNFLLIIQPREFLFVCCYTYNSDKIYITWYLSTIFYSKYFSGSYRLRKMTVLLINSIFRMFSCVYHYALWLSDYRGMLLCQKQRDVWGPGGKCVPFSYLKGTFVCCTLKGFETFVCCHW